MPSMMGIITSVRTSEKRCCDRGSRPRCPLLARVTSKPRREQQLAQELGQPELVIDDEDRVAHRPAFVLPFLRLAVARFGGAVSGITVPVRICAALRSVSATARPFSSMRNS